MQVGRKFAAVECGADGLILGDPFLLSDSLEDLKIRAQNVARQATLQTPMQWEGISDQLVQDVENIAKDLLNSMGVPDVEVEVTPNPQDPAKVELNMSKKPANDQERDVLEWLGFKS